VRARDRDAPDLSRRFISRTQARPQLRGPAADYLWDPALARMAQTGTTVMEERLILVLLTDLAAGKRIASGQKNGLPKQGRAAQLVAERDQGRDGWSL
jgi:hypothetical protein